MLASSSMRSIAPVRSAAWSRRILESIARGVAGLAREIRMRRDLRRLSGLDDAMLRDIGVARGGLENAVRFGRATEKPVRAPKRRAG